MSQNFLIACADGVLPVEKVWLESVSLYFKNKVEPEIGDGIFSDLTFRTEEVKFAFFICREALAHERKKESMTANEILADKRLLLSSLTFLDKYLFNKELVYKFFLRVASREKNVPVIKRLRSLRSFFHENHCPYSKELVFRMSQDIELYMLGFLEEKNEEIKSLRSDLDNVKSELSAIRWKNEMPGVFGPRVPHGPCSPDGPCGPRAPRPQGPYGGDPKPWTNY